MKLPGLRHDCSLTLTAAEASNSHLPAVRAAVEVRVGEFAGRHEQVWFERAALQQFAKGLRQLDASRKGGAELSGMSPGECDLRVEPCDAVGHCRVHIRLSRTVYAAAEYAPTVLSGTFEIDGDFLTRACDGAEELAAFGMHRAGEQAHAADGRRDG